MRFGPSVAVLALLPVVGACTATMPTAVPRTSPPLVAEAARWTAQIERSALPTGSVDPTDGFDPDEIALLAVVTNPSLRTVRGNRGVVQSQVVAAGLLPNPTLSFQPTIPLANNKEGLKVGYSGQLLWSVDPLLTRGPQVEAAELAQESVELDIAWAEWSVAMRAELLAVQIILLKRAEEIHGASIAEIRETLEPIRHAASVGSTTTEQLVSAEAALSQAETASAITRRELTMRSAELEGMLGGVVDVVGHLSDDLKSAGAVGDLDEDALLAHLVQRRPDLQAMRAAARSQNATYRAATREAFPSVEFGVELVRDASDVVAVGPSIQLGLPLLSGGQAGRAAARAESARLASLFDERLNEAHQRIAVALAEVKGSKAVLAILAEAIASQQRVVEHYGAARTRGALDILVYYNARATLVQLRLTQVSEEANLWHGLIQLRSESGLYCLPNADDHELRDHDAP